MPDTQFRNHLPDNISQVRTMIHVRHQHFIFLVHVIPVHAMHILGIEKITHLPPALVIDLHPFLMVINHSFHPFRGNGRSHVSGKYRKVLHLERGTRRNDCLFITGRKLDVPTHVGFFLPVQVINQRAASPVIIHPVPQHMHVTIVIRCQHGQLNKTAFQIREIIHDTFVFTLFLFILFFHGCLHPDNIIFRSEQYRGILCQRQDVHLIHIIVHVIPFRPSIRRFRTNVSDIFAIR